MIRTLAQIAVHFDLDTVANRVLERFHTGAPSGLRKGSRFQILVYHKVSPDQHPFYAPVDTVCFEEQMRFLSRSYRVMDLASLVTLSLRGCVPNQSVAITFDDGYRDNYEYAFPILKKYGLTATIFIATGVIGTGESLWHDRIFDAFRYTTTKCARLERQMLLELNLESPQAVQQSLDITIGKAKTLWGEARSHFVDEVEHALKPSLPAAPRRMLNWAEIREMHKAGIAFGSHTVTHPILSCLPPYELRKELTESKRRLEEELQVPIQTFAYPNGRASDYNAQTKAALQSSGYTCAVTTTHGVNPSFADPYELKRDLPWDSTIELFRCRFFLQRHGLLKN